MPPDYQMLQRPQKQLPHRNCAALPRTAKGLGRVKTKSDLVVMPCPSEFSGRAQSAKAQKQSPKDGMMGAF
jgi:hypothetical protein